MKRRLALIAGLSLAGCSAQPAPVHVLATPTTVPPPAGAERSLTIALSSTTTLPARTAPVRRASRSATRRPDPVNPGGAVAPITVSSTAYCETGLMANGQHTFDGAVAMNGQPIGSRWRVVESDRTYTVADRIGHGSQFDIAMPGDCAAARQYGRRTIHIERVA